MVRKECQSTPNPLVSTGSGWRRRNIAIRASARGGEENQAAVPVTEAAVLPIEADGMRAVVMAPSIRLHPAQ